MGAIATMKNTRKINWIFYILLTALTSCDSNPNYAVPSLVIRVDVPPSSFGEVIAILDNIAKELGLPKNDRSENASASMKTKVLHVDYDDGIGGIPVQIDVSTMSNDKIVDIVLFADSNDHELHDKFMKEIIPALGKIGEVTIGNENLKIYNQP